MRTISDEYVENIKTRILCSIITFCKINTFYEVM